MKEISGIIKARKSWVLSLLLPIRTKGPPNATDCAIINNLANKWDMKILQKMRLQQIVKLCEREGNFPK